MMNLYDGSVSDSDFGHATPQLPQMCHLPHTVCTATSRKMSLRQVFATEDAEYVTHNLPGKHTPIPGKVMSSEKNN